MATIGRPPTCLCGTCRKCKHRVTARLRYQAMTLDERRELIARRDKEMVRANDRTRYYRNRAERLARMREWAQNNPDRSAEIKESWRQENRDKARAHSMVHYYIRAGKLERQPCEVCGVQPTHAHHDDYSRPLDVRWLCPTHHGEHHRRYEVAA